jgi:hypothetical protein
MGTGKLVLKYYHRNGFRLLSEVLFLCSTDTDFVSGDALSDITT